MVLGGLSYGSTPQGESQKYKIYVQLYTYIQKDSKDQEEYAQGSDPTGAEISDTRVCPATKFPRLATRLEGDISHK